MLEVADAQVDEAVRLVTRRFSNQTALRRLMRHMLARPGYTPAGCAKIADVCQHLHGPLNTSEEDLRSVQEAKVTVVRSASDVQAAKPRVEKVNTGDKTRDSYYNALPKEIRMKVFKEGRDPRELYKELRSSSKEEMIRKYS